MSEYANIEMNAIEEDIARLHAAVNDPQISIEHRARAVRTISYLKSGASLAYRMQRNSKKPWAIKRAS